MKRVDKITALVLLVFSILVIVESSRMTILVEFAPGYGFLPFWLGVLMAFLSVLLYVDAWRRPTAKDSPQPFPPRAALIAVVCALGLVGLYALALETVGYVIDTLVMVFLLLAWLEKEDWKKSLAFTVTFTAALYLLFQVWLGISLPKNVFGF